MLTEMSEFEKFVKNEYKEFTIIGKYINKKTPILIKHNCGNEFLIQPQSFRLRPICTICKKKEKTEEYRLRFLEEIDKTFTNPKKRLYNE